MNMPGHASPASPPPSSATPRRKRRLWQTLAWLVAVMVLLTGVALGALAWVSMTPAGTQWVLGQAQQRLPQLTVEQAQGRLLGDFSAQRVRYRQPGLDVNLEGLSWTPPRWSGWQGHAPYVRLSLDRVHAEVVRVVLSPTGDEPAAEEAAVAIEPPAPSSLALPIEVTVEELVVDRTHLPGLDQPVHDIATRLSLAGTHRLDDLRARWRGLQLEGMAGISVASGLQTELRLAVRGDAAALTDAQQQAEPATTAPPSAQDASRPDAGEADAGAPKAAVAQTLPAWVRDTELDLDLRGPLEQLQGRLALQLDGQTLEVTAVVTPFERLPVSTLDARFDRLDLQRLLALIEQPGPKTALSGQAGVQLARDQPMSVTLQLENAQPGRWDEQRLPVTRLQLHAEGDGDRWTLRDSAWELPSGTGKRTGVARVRLDGSYAPQQIQARLHLDNLVLSALDQRLPVVRLAGPLDLDVERPADAASEIGLAQHFRQVVVNAKLRGNLLQGPAARAPPVSLTLQAQATPSEVTITEAVAQAGDARMNLRGRARLPDATQTAAARRWTADGELTLSRFDPSVWWPGAPGSAWRDNRHALTGTLRGELDAQAQAASPAQLIRTLRGRVTASLQDSLLMGQPLSLDLDLGADGRGGLELKSDLLATGNTARLDTSLSWPQPGSKATVDTDRIQLNIDAPALRRLSPILDLLQLPAVQGSVQVETSAVGPIGAWLARVAQDRQGKRAAAALTWPLLRAEGQASASDLVMLDLRLQSLQARWKADLREPASVSAQIGLQRLELPGLHASQASLDVEGSLANHRVALQAELQQRPGQPAGDTPAAPSDSQQPSARSAPRANLAAVVRGVLRLPDASATPARTALAWAGRLEELSLTLPDRANLPTLVSGRDLTLNWEVGPERVLAAVQPGQLSLFGTTLRWTQAQWLQPTDRNATLALEAQIDPVAVSPWLQRFQPTFGWEGDLEVAARISARATPTFRTDIVLFRTGGDLRVREGEIVQSLGLDALEWRYQADNGRWRMSQRINGSTLGTIQGVQTVRTDPLSWWPQADAPVEGDLRVRVAQLGAWGIWVPAGWRLGGQLQGQAVLSGRFGAPEFTGEIRGDQITARNAIEGVSLRDGRVRIALQGDSARIDAFRFTAGDGHAEITGTARLGASPSADLQLQAERFLLLGRVDRRVVLSGTADLVLTPQKLTLSGNLRADEGLIDITRADAPRLSDDVVVTRPGQTMRVAEMQATETDTRDVVLDLLFDPGDNFRLRGRGIDTRLTGELRLTNPRGRLGARGEIRTDRGTFEAYGQTLEIERGVLTFVGDIRNPRLDIIAIRARSEVRVGVTVGGSAMAPRLTLFSDPDMPNTEKLALLITGRSADNLGGAETILLQRAAFALLAGNDDTAGVDLPALLQLDEISVRQTDGVVQDTVVMLGKQISDRVYLGYERGLNSTTGTWQIIYRIAQRFTLRAQSGEDSALDLIWIFHWD